MSGHLTFVYSMQKCNVCRIIEENKERTKEQEEKEREMNNYISALNNNKKSLLIHEHTVFVTRHVL